MSILNWVAINIIKKNLQIKSILKVCSDQENTITADFYNALKCVLSRNINPLTEKVQSRIIQLSIAILTKL